MKPFAVAIAGLETVFKNGKITHFSHAFLNNCETWKKELSKTHDVALFDARVFRNTDNPIGDIFHTLSMIKRPIDKMLISCHSDWEGLYIISKYRKGSIPDTFRYIEKDQAEWDMVNFTDEATIELDGCRAGGNGKKDSKSIAQNIANITGASVFAFTSKSSQKLVNGGYRQVPWSGGYVEFKRS